MHEQGEERDDGNRHEFVVGRLSLLTVAIGLGGSQPLAVAATDVSHLHHDAW